MKHILLLLLTFSTLSAWSQTNCDCYERLDNLAYYKSSIGQSDSALHYYKLALQFLPVNARNYDHDATLAKYYLRTNQLDSSATYLTRAIEQGYWKNYDQLPKAFDALLNSSYREVITQAHFIPSKNFDWKYYNRLQQLDGMDQIIRTEALFPQGTVGLVDSITFMETMELIDLHGFPNQSEHGFINSLLGIFIHNSIRQNFFNRIIQVLEVANGHCFCGKVDIALITDVNSYLTNDHKQVVGTYNFNHGEYSVFQNIEDVDGIRFKHNLLTLKNNSEMRSFQLPEGYKPMPYPKGYFCEYKEP